MIHLTRQDLLRAFADKPEVASRVAAAIDAMGAGSARGDGILSESEIEAALKAVARDGFEAQGLRTGLQTLFGPDFQQAIPQASVFDARVRTELAAGTITERDLGADLRALCKDPALAARDATVEGYGRVAQWVAGELARAGVEPFGNSVDGQPSFYQGFRWENRFKSGLVSHSWNVVGRLPGKGPEPREAIVLIGHLDNLSQYEKEDYRRKDGRDLRRYEGANDNASAVAALLEVARGLREASDNQRDIIFLIPSAEEEGLKGTEAFAAAPPVPLDRMVGAINLEMVGRNPTEELLLYGGRTDADAAQNPLYARAMAVAERAGGRLLPGPRFDDGEKWYERSDHLITANAGIPSIMFHGRTAKGYHTDNDTLESLNVEKIRVTAQHVLRLVRDLANDPAPAEKRGPAKPQLTPFPGKVWPDQP